MSTYSVRKCMSFWLAERAEKYANKNSNTVTGVVIEALDTFLRGLKVD